jgi:hypothetical protein
VVRLLRVTECVLLGEEGLEGLQRARGRILGAAEDLRCTLAAHNLLHLGPRHINPVVDLDEALLVGGHLWWRWWWGEGALSLKAGDVCGMETWQQAMRPRM